MPASDASSPRSGRQLDLTQWKGWRGVELPFFAGAQPWLRACQVSPRKGLHKRAMQLPGSRWHLNLLGPALPAAGFMCPCRHAKWVIRAL